MRRSDLAPLLRIVTNSERSTSACERRWAFRYVDGLAIKSESPAPLRQGTLVHRLLDAWYRAGMPSEHDQASLGLMQLVVAPWLEQRNHYAESLDSDWNDIAEIKQENADIAAEAWGMFAHYVEHWGPRDRERWEVLGLGVQVARALQHPDKPKGGGIYDRPSNLVTKQAELVPIGKRSAPWRQWVQAGELDMLVRDKDTGLCWIVEHKTTDERDLVHYCRKLRLDPQVRAYAWLLEAPISDLSDVREPVAVAGVQYNVLRKAVPRVPKPLQGRKTKAAPNPPSPGLSRAAITTTRKVYLQAILQHGFNPDDYADMLSDLERTQFFYREEYVLTASDKADWERDAGHWALTAIEALRRSYHPRQTAVCQGPAAAPCAFAPICLQDGDLYRDRYQLRTVRHDELRNELAEPWPQTKERAQLAALTNAPKATTQNTFASAFKRISEEAAVADIAEDLF